MKMKVSAKIFLFAFYPLSLIPYPLSCAAEGEITLKTVTHVHSNRSGSGMQSMDDIIGRASMKGLDAVIFSDTALSKVEYGLWPLRNLLAARFSRPSVLMTGAENYLADINQLRKTYYRLLIVPGVEAAPYYRWSGNPASGLMLNDWNRHMLVLGLENADDYLRLPLLGNSKGYLVCWEAFWPFSLLLFAFIAKKAGFRKSAWLSLAAGVLFIADAWPFRCYKWNQYLSETPWGPYNALSAYAVKRGGLTFWAHPEAPNWEKPGKLSSYVSAQTLPYTECLKRTPDADGFAVFYEGYKKVALPGGEWDRSLDDYCRGIRRKPAWAVAELDYHFPGYNGTDIDSVYMNVHVRERSVPALMEALRLGKFESVLPSGTGALKLSRWELSHAGQKAGSGGTLRGAVRPLVSLSVESDSPSPVMSEIQVIRGGKVILEEKRALPAEISFADSGNDSKATFYRVMIRDDKGGVLVSNPIFSLAENL